MEKIIYPTGLNKVYPNMQNYTEYLSKSLNEHGIPFQDLFELGYQPDYQGILFILKTDADPDDLDRLSENVWNLGDDSFTITPTERKGYYLIDICQ